jgi:hypothetical protein
MAAWTPGSGGSSAWNTDVIFAFGGYESGVVGVVRDSDPIRGCLVALAVDANGVHERGRRACGVVDPEPALGAVSPDGKLLAVSTPTGTLLVDLAETLTGPAPTTSYVCGFRNLLSVLVWTDQRHLVAAEAAGAWAMCEVPGGLSVPARELRGASGVVRRMR